MLSPIESGHNNLRGGDCGSVSPRSYPQRCAARVRPQVADIDALRKQCSVAIMPMANAIVQGAEDYFAPISAQELLRAETALKNAGGRASSLPNLPLRKRNSC